jgi:hypothetical protein
VVASRLEEHLDARSSVQLLEYCEDLPEAESDAHALQLVLEELRIELLRVEQLRRNDFDVRCVTSGALIIGDALLTLLLRDGSLVRPPDLLLELLFELGKRVWRRVHGILDVGGNLRGDDALVDLEVVDLVRGRVLEVLDERGDVDLLVAV